MDQRLSTISDLMNEMGIEKATAKKEVEVKTGEMVSEKETPLQPQEKEEEK